MTVHDLIFERYPEHHTQRNRLYLRVAMPIFVRAASAIIAVSRHTRNDLVELYGADPAKIHVVYEGVDERFRPADAGEIRRVAEQYSPDRPYLLMVGTLEPRKNHAAALRALARLKAWGWPHRLLLVGGQGWLFEPIRRQIEEEGLAGDVHFAGYVPDADLPPLYSGAAAVIVPSLYEGFGFPVLEAMACGAPVVCSNASSLPEVAGEAALLAGAEDDLGIAHAVQLLLEPAGGGEGVGGDGAATGGAVPVGCVRAGDGGGVSLYPRLVRTPNVRGSPHILTLALMRRGAFQVGGGRRGRLRSAGGHKVWRSGNRRDWRLRAPNLVPLQNVLPRT